MAIMGIFLIDEGQWLQRQLMVTRLFSENNHMDRLYIIFSALEYTYTKNTHMCFILKCAYIFAREICFFTENSQKLYQKSRKI